MGGENSPAEVQDKYIHRSQHNNDVELAVAAQEADARYVRGEVVITGLPAPAPRAAHRRLNYK